MDMEWNQALTFSEMVKDPLFLTGEISAVSPAPEKGMEKADQAERRSCLAER